MFFKESGKKEFNFSDKDAARMWNGMDPIKRDNVLFRLLSKEQVKAYEITEFRERHDFTELPKHIQSALVEYWKDK